MTREEAANILDPEMDTQYLFDFIREHYGKHGVDNAFLCECVDAEACHMGAEALRRIDALALDGKHNEGCAWCKAEYTIIDDEFAQPISQKMIKFCWHCGRELYNNTADKMRHNEPKTPCDLCLYNPPSSGDGKPCTMCPASSPPETSKEGNL